FATLRGRIVRIRSVDGAGRIEAVHRRAAELVDDLRIARGRAHEHRIPVELFRGRDRADGLADDGAHHDAITAGLLHLADLRGEVRRAALVGRALDVGRADVLQPLLGPAHDLEPE